MKLLSLEEAAVYFNVHTRTIIRWLKKGSLKGYKLGKGKTALIRISEAEVERFLNKHIIK